MDGQILELILEIAPSVASYIPKIRERLKGKEDEEMFQSANLALIAVLIESTNKMNGSLESISKKVDVCDEGIGTLLKRSKRLTSEMKI